MKQLGSETHEKYQRVVKLLQTHEITITAACKRAKISPVSFFFLRKMYNSNPTPSGRVLNRAINTIQRV